MNRWVRAWNADEDGLAPDDWREIWWGMDCHDRLMRWRALKAMWLAPVKSPPRDSRKGWTIYDGYERNRDDEWTFWRGIRATIGVLLDRHWHDEVEKRHRAKHGFTCRLDIAFWDARDIYGGYTIEHIWLYPGCRVSIFNGGETNL